MITWPEPPAIEIPGPLLSCERTPTSFTRSTSSASIAVFDYRHAGLADITQTIRRLGGATGHTARAEETATGIEQALTRIRERAAAGSLNRGLSLSLPYFDDQSLQMKVYEFRVIPHGRIMFVPALVVRAAREEQVKVAQDTRLSPSNRNYLLEGLVLLEQAFLPVPSSATGM